MTLLIFREKIKVTFFESNFNYYRFINMVTVPMLTTSSIIYFYKIKQ
ncbi:hypothetical protein M109_2737 [Bacteroides fragilis str. 3397 N2]|nr:hypothetical protein M109_2737 [Bacteroides fragilis str. 3397 N2]EXZ53210.1 hypothetical protein M108_2820 [Bacteroides fragilis str. 3397 T14]EYA43046.1 hypothetical protein M110_2843 [Bacteroides fragilis str. 3397 N3]